MEYYVAIKRNRLLLYATIWKDLKGLTVGGKKFFSGYTVGFLFCNILKIAKLKR